MGRFWVGEVCCPQNAYPLTHKLMHTHSHTGMHNSHTYAWNTHTNTHTLTHTPLLMPERSHPSMRVYSPWTSDFPFPVQMPGTFLILALKILRLGAPLSPKVLGKMGWLVTLRCTFCFLGCVVSCEWGHLLFREGSEVLVVTDSAELTHPGKYAPWQPAPT